jgi:hypothetical protein
LFLYGTGRILLTFNHNFLQMPKKIKFNLTYSNNILWWTTDETNWAPVGPGSPYTMVQKQVELEWLGDGTIDEITITLDNTDLIDTPITGSAKDKNGKIKDNPAANAHTKYTINVTPAGASVPISFDPDIKSCPNPPCDTPE